MLDIVTISLDSNPKLVPHCARRRVSTIARTGSGDGDDVSTPRQFVKLTAGDTPSIAEDEDEGIKEDLTETVIIEDDQARFSTSPISSSPSSKLGSSTDADYPDKVDQPSPTSSPEGDPDDFIIMDENQAKRIVGLCKYAFGVELSADVVVADANVGALAQRIVGAKSLTGAGGDGGGWASGGLGAGDMAPVGETGSARVEAEKQN